MAVPVGVLAALAMLAGTPRPTSLRIRVLEKYRPEAAVVSRQGERHTIAVSGAMLIFDDALVAVPLALGPGLWRIDVAGAAPRVYRGEPSFAVNAGRLDIVVRMRTEDYVAAVVASETVPVTPLEALKAQAVVVRSFALAARGRHEGADLCDLAHCQVLGGPAPRGHRAAAIAATRATSGEVLLLASGRVAEAPFHAACGGHTGDPVELFGGDSTGAAAVPDVDCPESPWSAVIPERLASAVIRERLSPEEASPLAFSSVEPRYGAGGYLVQVSRGGHQMGGEAFARALDGAMGYGVVRSSRFRAHHLGDSVLLSGSGLGHGAGLCQTGAAMRAARGEGYVEVLRHYFPLARLAKGRQPTATDEPRP